MAAMTAADPAVILDTLELVAERHGDPTALIYRQLFAAHPDFERLFAYDRDGGVRASMVQQAFECIIDHAGPRLTSAVIIAAERSRHDGYGVPAGMFDAFFLAMTEAFRQVLGEDWTALRAAHWRALLAEFAAIR